jgi:asparagine synthase (glutamine-hydrolysing)
MLKPFGITLGMTRLKIVDQRDLKIPFDFSRLGVKMAFNGEIYNWKALRSELQSYGPWGTECDAEILAAAWRAWGPKCFEKFNGMWSLCLIDTWSDQIVICRDRAGKKPLFYQQLGDQLYIASEAKALPQVKTDLINCVDMETFEYDVLEQTPLLGIKRLLPGHYALLNSLDDALTVHPQEWWRLPERKPVARYNEQELTSELEALILDAVRIRTDAEVPIALQLSGGLDSAIIYRAAQRCHHELPLYCVTFPNDGIDNMTRAQLAAPGRAIQPVSFGYEALLRELPKIAYHLDTPATWSAVALWHLAEQISADGNRIVLSGEGADELFCGYTRYRILYWLEQMQQDERLQDYSATVKHAVGAPRDVIARLLNRGSSPASIFRADSLVERYSKARDPLYVQMARVEFHTTMQVLLRMGDRMAAAWSLENRCPLLDYRIIEFSTRVPEELLIDSKENKHILRQVARRLGVHPEITDEITKRGLFIPWQQWHRPSALSSRGAWDRSSFSSLMNAAWIESIQKLPHCTQLPAGC